MTDSDTLHVFDQLFAYLRKIQDHPELLTPTMRIELERLKRIVDEALEEDADDHPSPEG